MTAWRRRLGAMVGGFEAGQRGRRLKSFQPSRAHINTLIGAAEPDITARARWLVRNNGYAVNAIESWAGNVVGAGIKPSSLIEDAALKARVQRLWLTWTDEADAEGFTDVYGLQRRAARELFIAGEVFFRFRPRRPEDGLSVPLQLQMLPAEMLPLTHNEVLPGGRAIRQGIEVDALGRRVAYHFLRRHPGDLTDPGLAGETVRVPAGEIIHLVDPTDGGQLRGVSRFAPALVKLFLLVQYDDAELDRKKVAAMHALFITTPAPAEPFDLVESDGTGGERTMDLQPGQIVLLEPGEEVQTSAPADVGETYEAFQYRTLLQVSAALARRGGALRRARPAGLRAAARGVRGVRVAAAEVGLGRSAEGRTGRDRADRRRPEEPHPGAGRARLRCRTGRRRDRRRPRARTAPGAGVRSRPRRHPTGNRERRLRSRYAVPVGRLRLR
ncbi:MAG TPA: phage portal protein [Azospirillaceae bacterium]|nr:phage portal protein [Azospirillaceae bacterium]